MLTAHCHCGAVEITIPRAPLDLTNCSCSICRRYGVLWAYFDSPEVSVIAAPGATAGYAWGDRTRRETRMGVNARMFDPEQLGDVRIRWLDGAGTEQYLT